MIRKLLILAVLLLSASESYGADNYTVNYNLCIPEEDSFNWLSKISEDIVSIDNLVASVSRDSAWVGSSGTITTRSGVTQATVGGVLSIDDCLIVSAESTATMGGQVGRIQIISSDGVTKCYIPIYAGA